MSSRVHGLVGQVKLRIELARARSGAVDVAIRTFKRFSEDDGGSYAAALTYYIFFSIFPLLLFAVAALGYLTFGNQQLQQDIFDAGLESFPLISEVLTRESLARIQEQRNGLALTGFVLALYTGSGAIVALEHALNKVLHLREEPNFVAKRLNSLKWLAVLGVGALVSAAFGGLRNLGSTVFGEGSLASYGIGAVATILGVLVSVALFGTTFKVLPGKDQPWRDVIPGAVAAALAFEVLKAVGAGYLKSGAQSREATFGALAAAAGLLVASYLVSQITLLSAELNAVLRERRLTRRSSLHEATGGAQ